MKTEEKEADKNNFIQFHKDVAKIVDKYMVEVEMPAIRAKYRICFCYIGVLMGAFLMFLACI